MNKSWLVWGCICLCLAGLFAALILGAPLERPTFRIGNADLPWVLPVVLACAGVCLLAGGLLASAARRGEEAGAAPKPSEAAREPAKVALNKRLEAIGWGLFLIMLGGFALVPRELVNGALWSIGIGLIMLGLNGARYVNQIKMSGFTTVLGTLALLGGIADLLDLTAFQGALLLVILGAYLILKPWFDQKRLFGRAEEA